MDGVEMTLPEHDKRSDERAEVVLKAIHKPKKEYKMSDDTAALLAAMGNRSGGADASLGMGGGLIGGVVLGALLGGNRGLLGSGTTGVAEGCVTSSQLTAGLASVIDSQQNTTLLQSVGDVKAAVPLAEAQVQLALAGAQSDIISQGTANATAAARASQLTNKNISDAIASGLAGQATLKEAIATYGVANLTATKDAQFATQVAISGSTKEILAALNDQNTANLQRQLAVAESALLERNAALRARETEINITNTNTATAQQFQVQSQQQQQAVFNATVLAHLQNLQVATATNSNLIVGNAGATTTGAQTANPVNVRA